MDDDTKYTGLERREDETSKTRALIAFEHVILGMISKNKIIVFRIFYNTTPCACVKVLLHRVHLILILEQL